MWAIVVVAASDGKELARPWVFPIFMGTWVVLGIFGLVMFARRGHVDLKRKVHKPFVITVGVLFLGFMAAMGVPWHVLLISAPFVMLITVMNIRGTSFCSECGKTMIDPVPWTRVEYCSSCGARLTR